jgi:hypothetical protein
LYQRILHRVAIPDSASRQTTTPKLTATKRSRGSDQAGGAKRNGFAKFLLLAIRRKAATSKHLTVVMVVALRTLLPV